MTDTLPRFECKYCPESFGRQEHLQRHLARHSRKRPFECSVCGRCFPRRDTLKRHITTHGPNALRIYRASLESLGISRTKACLKCAQAKKRCSGTAPCQRCHLKSLSCEFADTEKASPSKETVAPTIFDSAVTSNSADHNHTESFVQITPGPSPTSSQPFEGQFQNPAEQQAFLDQQLTLAEFVSNAGDLVDAAGSGLFDPHLLSGLDFPFNWGFPEEGINCNFMTGPSHPMEGQAGTPLPSGVGATTPAVGPSWSSKTPACSIPVAEQQDDQDILLAEDFSHVTPLSEAAYERVKHLFENLTIGRTENVKLALPSAAGMNALIQLSFEYFIHSFPIIHPATFDPNTVPEHVLIAVAAVGVNYTASFRKDQYRKCFMRLLEDNLPAQLPRKPSSKVDISTLECLILYNMCLMFSGSHRDLLRLQYERNILPTLYRQVRILGKCTGMQDGSISPEGANEECWKAWIARERVRRAMHGIWMLECLHRIFLDHHPVLSPPELTIPLPAAEELWDAPDADSWGAVWIKTWKGKETPSLSTLFAASQPSSSQLSELGELAKTIVMMTFSVEEQRIHDLSRCWISAAATPGTREAARSPYDASDASQPETRADQHFFFSALAAGAAAGQRRRHAVRTRLGPLLAILRAVRLRTLHAFSGWRATDAEVSAATGTLATWFAQNRARARECVLHAGALLGGIRAQADRLPFDPFVLLAGVLYLWAWQVLSPDLGEEGEGQSEGGRGGGGGGGLAAAALRIDGDVDEGLARAWVEGRARRPVRVAGVGVLTGDESARRLLKEFRRILLAQTAWTSFHWWLAECATQLIQGEKPREQLRRTD